ncbi:MAG: hypothetical protein R3B06_25565 [Kofleriaceae bacterium]
MGIQFVVRNLPLIVAHYARVHRPKARAELASFAEEGSGPSARARGAIRPAPRSSGSSFWPGDIADELAPLRELAPYEIEDVLRINKAKFDAVVLELSERSCRLPEEEDE